MSQSPAVSPPVPLPDRDQRGRLLPGNRTARRTGLYGAAVDAVLEAERERYLQASLQDDGGADDVPVRRRSLHAYRARVHQHVAQVSDALARYGLFDRRGRLRGTWLSKFESLVATAIRLDTLLGLERRAKDVLTLEDYLKAKTTSLTAPVTVSATNRTADAEHDPT